MSRRVIAIILVFSMMVSISGCGGVAAGKEKVLAEGVITEENSSLSGEGLGLHIDPVNFTGELNAKITSVPGSPPLDEEGEIQLQVYDFTVEGMTEFPGVIELTIPLEVGEGEKPGAAYLNSETEAWEPVVFRYDDSSKTLTILTDHLSRYGVFSYSGQGKRYATVQYLGLYGIGEDHDFLQAVEEFSVAGVPAAQCIEIGASAAGDALGIGGDMIGNIVQGAGYMAYGEDILSSIGDSLGKIGLLVSVVQIGSNIYNNKINDALAGSMKTAFTYIMGKVAGKLSSSVMSASMASVAIVDYSINKFGTTAIEGRKAIYRDAYSIYYQKGEDGFRTSAHWFNLFYPYFSNPTMTQDEIKAEVDRIVTEHCDEFWGGKNKLGVDYYVSEAREKFNWTGGQAGLNEDMRKEISAERRAILYNDILPGVFEHIAYKINLENEKRLNEEYSNLVKFLNTQVRFSIVDQEGIYDKHRVRFSPLNDKAIVENWTGTLKKGTTMSSMFTLYGHMYAGGPDTVDIYEPDADLEKDKPIRSTQFKVVIPEFEIVFGDVIKGLKFEGGERDKISQMGLYAALRETGTIKVDEDGTFSFDVPYATANGGGGNNTFSSEVSGFHMEGKLDPGSLSGNATFNGTFLFRRKEISPLEGMDGETKEYVTTYSYDDMVNGTVKISGEGDTVTFNTSLEAVRSGFTKLQYHSISPDGTELWGDNPTITDKSETYNGSSSYTYTVER
jgi:hypothetical protein